MPHYLSSSNWLGRALREELDYILKAGLNPNGCQLIVFLAFDPEPIPQGDLNSASSHLPAVRSANCQHAFHPRRDSVSVLLTRCCVTNCLQTHQLKATNICYLTVSVDAYSNITDNNNDISFTCSESVTVLVGPSMHHLTTTPLFTQGSPGTSPQSCGEQDDKQSPLLLSRCSCPRFSLFQFCKGGKDKRQS